MKGAIFILAAAVAASGGVGNSPAGAAPGAIFAQTARAGVTLTPAGQGAQTGPLKPGEIFAASGQVLSASTGLAAVLIFSNGDALYLPKGGRLTLEEFTQDPIPATGTSPDYEPSRSTVRLNLAQGTLVVWGRQPNSTSVLTVNTPLARLDLHSHTFAVCVNRDSISVTLFDGTAGVTVAETGFHDIVQAGQTAVLARKNLHASYPLKMADTTTEDSDQINAWLTAAQTTEQQNTFAGAPGHLQLTQRIPQSFFEQIAVDDPRYR